MNIRKPCNLVDSINRWKEINGAKNPYLKFIAHSRFTVTVTIMKKEP